MGFIRKSIMAGAAFWAIHTLRQKRKEVQATENYSTRNNQSFNDNTATSENTMPEVKVQVEPTTSTVKH